MTAVSQSLAGKRVALVGFPPPRAMELTQIIMDAEGFTRPLAPLQVDPASDVLKPFELILLDIEASTGTAWLDPEKSAPVHDRCVAVGDAHALLQVAAQSPAGFREYWVHSGEPQELLLRCYLALRARAAQTPQRTAPTGSTVVLADDDTSVTSIVRRALERNGMTCELAATGKDALALITKLKPCAAVLDVHMPTIDGFEVLSRTRSNADLAQTRVILLTGSEQESDVIRGFTLGADDYICKPFNPMELTIRLMRVLGRL
jgi:CheY-like chemotaxis protein